MTARGKGILRFVYLLGAILIFQAIIWICLWACNRWPVVLDRIVDLGILLTVLVAGVYTWHAILRRNFIKQNGYWFEPGGRHSDSVYYEWHDGEKLTYSLSRFIVDRASNTIRIPSEAEWQRWAPDWLQNRRKIVWRRLRQFSGFARWTFIEK